MNADRRTILTAGAFLAAAATPIAALAQSSSQMSRDAAMSMPDTSGVRTAQQFAMGVIGPAELSLVTSRIAVDRATKPDAREFAGFELTEAVAITTVLKQLGTPVPSMSPRAHATLEQIRHASTGAQFDEAYIDAQYQNHVFLRDLATNYLRNSSEAATDMMEMHGRHLATLALATFKEHTQITQRISTELRS